MKKEVRYFCDSCKNFGSMKIDQARREPLTVACWNCKENASLFADSVLSQRIQSPSKVCFRCGTVVVKEISKKFNKAIQMCQKCSDEAKSRFYLEESKGTKIADEMLCPVVYFLQPKEGGNIKIGFTRTLYKRFNEIEACSPLLLKIILVIGGPKSLEERLHLKFRKHRVHYEWFKPHDDILNFVDMYTNLKRRQELNKFRANKRI